MKVPDEYAYLNTNTLVAEGQQPFEHTQQPHNSMPRSDQKVNSMPRSNHKVARICCRLDPPSTASPNNMRAIPRKIPACPTGRPAPALLCPGWALPANFFSSVPFPQGEHRPALLLLFCLRTCKEKSWAGWTEPTDSMHTGLTSCPPSRGEGAEGCGGQPQRRGGPGASSRGDGGGGSCRIHNCSGGAEHGETNAIG